MANERTTLLQNEPAEHAQNGYSNQPFLAPLGTPGPQAAAGPSGPNGQAGAGGPTFSASLYHIDPFTVDALRRADIRARRRFTLALLLGFFSWLVLGLIVTLLGGEGAGWWDDTHRNRRNGRDWPGELPKIVPSRDGNVTTCLNFLNALPTSAIVIPENEVLHWKFPYYPIGYEEDSTAASPVLAMNEVGGPPYTFYKSKSYFHIEMTEQDGFYILAKGKFSVGPVKILIEEPKSIAQSSSGTLSKKPVVEVEVTARWNDKDLLKSAKVCSLERPSEHDQTAWEYGVGIFSPQPSAPDEHRHLSFETVVRLPPSGLTRLVSLRVSGPSFSPVEVAASPMAFDMIDIVTANGPVSIPKSYSLASRYAKIRTSNGRIEGVYNTSDELVLESTNGPIRASVNLVADGDSKDLQDRRVKVETTNGGIALNYASHPDGIVLDSRAKTTNGDADVRHSNAFEGSFELRTSWGKGLVTSRSDASNDPTGKHRKRVLDMTRDDNTIGIVDKAGEVYWAPRDDTRMGKSTVVTSLGRASLDFE